VTPTKVLVGQSLLVLTIVLLGIWGATQWAAFLLDNQPRLGVPWFFIEHYPVYQPFAFFFWWYWFGTYAPGVFAEASALAAGGGIAGAVLAVVGSVWRAREHKLSTTFGSARWANAQDVKATGLIGNQGVFLGRFEQHYLRHDGPEHVMCFAPTRSGKGVGLVIPTLLTWPHSAVIHDIKGECWELTAGWRSRFSHCLLFDPTDLRSARYNPLLEVRRGPNEVRDVQNIADILVDPEGMLERRTHWEKTAHGLLVGAILHVLYAAADKSLAGVATFLSDPARPFERTLRAMMTTNHLGTPDAPRVHPVVASAAREVLNKSENERSGVLSTAMSYLGLYRDPVIAAVTSSSDWRIADLVDAAHPVSLYLVIPASDISRTRPLIRLVLNQLGRRLTERRVRAVADNRRQLLLMLDEFPALGRLDFFESTLAFMASYGIRAFLIAQSLNQIAKAYGDSNAILDNCALRVAFATSDERTAKRISDALGTKTELRAQRNYAGHRLAPWLSHLMVSRQESARQLMTTGEVMTLPASEEIVMVSGQPPIRAKKLRYYADRNFKPRILPEPVLPIGGPYPDRPTSRPDDWSELATLPAGTVTMQMIEPGKEGGFGEGPLPGLPDTEPERDRSASDHDMAVLDDDDGNQDDAGKAFTPGNTVRRAVAIDDGLVPPS
jgi:type IV secretion system protein VirD4